MNTNEASKGFGFRESLELDDGTMDGIPAELAFAMGVEWERFRQRLKTGRPFITRCRLQNATRFVKTAEQYRRYVEDRPNIHPGWSEVFVGDYVALNTMNHSPEPDRTTRHAEEMSKRERPMLWLLLCGSIWGLGIALCLLIIEKLYRG